MSADSMLSMIARDEEDFLLHALPEEAWNLAIAGASRLDIVRALQTYGRVRPGLREAVEAAEKMQRMLAGLGV